MSEQEEQIKIIDNLIGILRSIEPDDEHTRELIIWLLKHPTKRIPSLLSVCEILLVNHPKTHVQMMRRVIMGIEKL